MLDMKFCFGLRQEFINNSLCGNEIDLAIFTYLQAGTWYEIFNVNHFIILELHSMRDYWT